MISGKASRAAAMLENALDATKRCASMCKVPWVGAALCMPIIANAEMEHARLARMPVYLFAEMPKGGCEC